MKRLATLLASLALALSVAVPVAANHNTNDNVHIWTGDNATGAVCHEIHGDRSDLWNVGTCGNWDNRINSLKVNIQDGHCYRFYTGQGYTGTVVLTVYGPASYTGATYNFSSAYDNTISSWYNGVRTKLSSGAYTCSF